LINSRTDRIDKLIAAQRPGWSLDRPFYQDQAIFERERERLFCKQWIMAGHVSQIPHQGDYFLLDMAGESIIVIRSQEGAVQAFYNVCRHRGSRILSKNCGNAKSLRCPYHGWNYACDGSLQNAPRMPADFDPALFPLKSCPSRVIEGLIFICLSTGDAPELDEITEGLAPFLQLHGIGDAEIVQREVFSLDANWKLAVENYLECYHCKPAHKEYSRIEIKAEKMGDGSPAAMQAWNTRETEWRELATRLGTLLDDFTSQTALQDLVQTQCGAAYRAPLRATYQTASEDGKPVAPLMGSFTEYDGGETALAIGPFTYSLAYNDYATFLQFVPLDAGHCDIIISWLVRPGAEAAPEYDLNRLTWLWMLTTHQDKTIIEDNAKGICSNAYEPGPVSLLEGDVAGFRQWYLAIIGSGKQNNDNNSTGRRRYFG